MSEQEKKTTSAAGTPEPDAGTADTAPAADTAAATAAGAEPSAGQTADKAEAKAAPDPVAAELAAAKDEAAKTKDLLLRTAAEYDNYRKRTTREKEASFGNGMTHVLEKILPLIDTLELAAGAETADENYKKGVLMTLDKARAILRELNVEEIPSLGQPFDPELHSAVMQQPAAEGQKPGMVVQVMQKGYRRCGKVLRHAMVAVSA